MTEAQQQQWMSQWRRAAQELARVKREELAAMTPEDALAITERVFAPNPHAYIQPDRRTFSGLVIQQQLFQRARERG